MWIKPPLVLLVGTIFVVFYFNYFILKIWFRPYESHKAAKKRIGKLPWWYPFRGYYLASVSDEKGWISKNRIMAIFAELFVITFAALVITAWLHGE